MLLDPGSNIFLLNKKLVTRFTIPYEVRQKPIDIGTFDGVPASSAGKKYSDSITLVIGHGHWSTLCAEIAAAGHYDLVIPFEGGIRNIHYPIFKTRRNGNSNMIAAILMLKTKLLQTYRNRMKLSHTISKPSI